MKYLLVLSLIILISFMFFSCSGNNKTETLYPVDSLGWQNEEGYMFTEVYNIHSDGTFLYCLDGSQSKMFIYDANTMEYVRHFGEKGNGPEEIYYSDSFILRDEQIKILDMMGKKILTFSKKGEYINEFKLDRLIMQISSWNEKDYAMTFHNLPEVWIYEIAEDSLTLSQKIQNVCDGLNINKAESGFGSVRFTACENRFLIMHINPNIIGVTSDSLVTRIDIEYPDFIDIDKTQFRSVLAVDDGFILVGFFELELEEASVSFALHYNFDGSLKKSYKLSAPPQSGIMCSCISGDRLYTVTYSGIIYKYDID